MAEFFLDHENTTLYPSAYLATPSGPSQLPQDGDGTVTGTGATPASAVGNVVFSAPSGTPTAGSVSVLGATVTPSYSSNADTQANNLATAINASTATCSLTTQQGSITAPYLRAMVWARGPSGGAAAGTCEIYSRIATAAFNTGTNVTVASWNNITATPSDLRGGVAGPFRYFFNTAALGVSVAASVSGAIGTYGGTVNTVMGAVADGDIIHIRSKRSGADVQLAWPASGVTVVTRSKGTLALPLVFAVDAGVKWPGDSGVFRMVMDGSLNVNRKFIAPNVTSLSQIWRGIKLTETTCNWRIEVTNTPASGNYTFYFGSDSNAVFYVEIDGVEVSGTGGASIANVNHNYAYVRMVSPGGSSNSAYQTHDLMTCKRMVIKSAAKQSFFHASPSSSFSGSIRVEDCIVDATGLTEAAVSALVNLISTGGDCRFTAVGSRWLNFPAAANQSGFQNNATTRAMAVRMIDCEHANIKVSGGAANGGVIGMAGALTARYDRERSILITSKLGTRPFVWENSVESFVWNDSAAPRTPGAMLPDGVTTFSVRTAVTTEAGVVSKGNPVEFSSLAKHNSLADGDRTATLRLLVDVNHNTALGGRAPRNDELWVTIRYVHTSGVSRVVTSRADVLATPATLTSGSSGDWSITSYDVNGISHTYNPYEITVSCPGMKTLTEVSLTFGQAFAASSVDDLIFLDPEWTLV